jgi:hypothetical protein
VQPANVTVIVAPCEMRGRPAATLPADPPWTAELYAALARELQPFAP